MAKANDHYGYFLSCLIILIVAHFGVATVVPHPGGKKLIIGVPNKFDEFVDTKLESKTSHFVQVSGYSIDIFNATVDYLLNHCGFNISYELRPFIPETRQSAGTYYDQLVQQVHKHQYDAAVGDISIVAKRANYVDFTLPYMGSGVRMLVRVEHRRHLNMWIFLRPFSWDLWLSVTAACAFIGATVQLMERNIDNDAQPEGSPCREQLKGISIIWLPLAQVVLPQRESVAKSCSKFVLVVWLILAFVLIQSYTASLSSILTVNRLQPSYPSMDDLKRNGEKIGYPKGSFLSDMLVDKLKFDKSQLIDISNIDDYQKALDKGSRKGGVAVIFDEIPYIKVFLRRYGSKYMMVGPHYRAADGFGFAFPINSSLTSYFSRAILNVTQNVDLMERIERYYFGSIDYDLQNDSDQLSSNAPSLTTESFAGLFMITGIATVLALLVSESHIWRRPVKLAKVYSQKLLLSPRWTKSKQSVDVSTTRGSGSSINEPNSIPESTPRSPYSDRAFETMHV